MKRLFFLICIYPSLNFGQITLTDEMYKSLPEMSQDKNYAYQEYIDNRNKIGSPTDWKIVVDNEKRFEFKYYDNHFIFHFKPNGNIILVQQLFSYDDSFWIEQLLNIKNDNDYDEIKSSINEVFGYKDENNIKFIKSKVYKNKTDYDIVVLAHIEKYQQNNRGRVTSKKQHILIVRGFDVNMDLSSINKKESYMEYLTSFSSDINLMDENILYSLEKYAYAFLLDLLIPKLTNFDGSMESKFPDLNQKDFALLSNYISKVANVDEHKLIEFISLPDNTIAVSIGNVFDNGIFKIQIDPIKFRNASPQKRAYIFWHEGFHSLGLIHGECGKMMFPYADKDYTWLMWAEDKEETIKCWIEKRNSLNNSL